MSRWLSSSRAGDEMGDWLAIDLSEVVRFHANDATKEISLVFRGGGLPQTISFVGEKNYTDIRRIIWKFVSEGLA